MTQQEKINYMQIATGIVGYGFNTEGMDLLVSIYELVIEKKGDADLNSILKLKNDVKERNEEKSIPSNLNS